MTAIADDTDDIGRLWREMFPNSNMRPADELADRLVEPPNACWCCKGSGWAPPMHSDGSTGAGFTPCWHCGNPENMPRPTAMCVLCKGAGQHQIGMVNGMKVQVRCGCTFPPSSRATG